MTKVVWRSISQDVDKIKKEFKNEKEEAICGLFNIITAVQRVCNSICEDEENDKMFDYDSRYMFSDLRVKKIMELNYIIEGFEDAIAKTIMQRKFSSLKKLAKPSKKNLKLINLMVEKYQNPRNE